MRAMFHPHFLARIVADMFVVCLHTLQTRDEGEEENENYCEKLARLLIDDDS